MSWSTPYAANALSRRTPTQPTGLPRRNVNFHAACKRVRNFVRMVRMQACSFCRRAGRALVYETSDLACCAICARRAGSLLLDGGAWALFGVDPPRETQHVTDDEELEHDLELLTADDPAPVSDADVHADLAVAYREMGMDAEALFEAARSICSEDRAAPDEAALDVFLGDLDAEKVRALRDAMFGAV
jgi:hypothetical protein